MSTSTFVDFAQLKEKVRIEQCIEWLGLKMRQTGDQYRGPCPACQSGGDRSLAINSEKQGFYCFSAKRGGDLIALVAHVRGYSQKDAAAKIAEQFSVHGDTVHSSRNTSSRSPPKKPSVTRQEPLQPLAYLEPTHPSVQALGVSPETAQTFGAGYAPKGIMRGRFAIPLHDSAGTLVAYCGRAVKDESPALIFPNGFHPESLIFAAERVQPGPICLVRDPLQVLTAHESGIENVVAFLTETISAQQLEMLAALMDEKKCESVELY